MRILGLLYGMRPAPCNFDVFISRGLVDGLDKIRIYDLFKKFCDHVWKPD